MGSSRSLHLVASASWWCCVTVSTAEADDEGQAGMKSADSVGRFPVAGVNVDELVIWVEGDAVRVELRQEE